MPSVAERVHEVLEDDMFLLEALARDIVGYRNLARWMKTEKGIDAAEETIVSAIRRFDPEEPWDLGPAKEVLSEAHVHTRTGVTALILSRTSACQRLEEIVSAIDIEAKERLRIVQAAGRVTLVVDDRSLGEVKDVLGPALIDDEIEDIAELGLVAPERGVDTPGVLGVVFAALSVRDVSVRFTMSGYPEQLVFVPEEDILDAYRAVDGLIESSGS